MMQYLFDVIVKGTNFIGYGDNDSVSFAADRTFAVVVPNQDIATVVDAVERLMDEDFGRDQTGEGKNIRKDYTIDLIKYRETVRL